jgi:hypothetical protein
MPENLKLVILETAVLSHYGFSCTQNSDIRSAALRKTIPAKFIIIHGVGRW